MGADVFIKHLENRISNTLNEATQCRSLEHNALVGEIREILIRNLIKPLLPVGVNAGSGVIWDNQGNSSAQTDIVIYDRRGTPPILYDDSRGNFPIDAVYYAIEVKSCLKMKETKDSIEKGKRLRSLKGPQPHSVLLALKSDLPTGGSWKRLCKLQEINSCQYPVNIICIAQKEYVFWVPEKSSWGVWEGENSFSGFLCGMMNTLAQPLYLTRPTNRPGSYFLLSQEQINPNVEATTNT